MIRRLKNLMLPKSVKPRTVPLGLARGARMMVDFRWDAGFFFGRHERELFAHYKRLVRPGTRCFDVGAYRGWNAVIFARLSGNAGVVTFESNPRTLGHLRDTVDLSGYDVNIVHGYVGDGASEDQVTLDDAAEQYFAPGFVKVDIEGAEACALRGAQKLLEAQRPSWVIEVHGADVEAECCRILRNVGYEPVIVNPRSYIGKQHRQMELNRWIVCEGETLNGRKRL